jgi:hypothetical protein
VINFTHYKQVAALWLQKVGKQMEMTPVQLEALEKVKRDAESRQSNRSDEIDHVNIPHIHKWKRGLLPGSIQIRTCIDPYCLASEEITPEVWANTP